MFTQGTCKFELFFHIPYTDGDALYRVFQDVLLNETSVRIFPSQSTLSHMLSQSLVDCVNVAF